ncbi:hypothetical protein QN382_08445 [Pseudomonas sp. 10B1]|uniref:DUF6555 family protein n=1 Tax=unclassified Pseudomonas TaxID=196821 RepID=UPI002AB41B79|nr:MULTISPECIES: DUF6555 family protein [unclassified Pseudomonas]MDY7559883.1 hypothetical protein [Pseudomonas sp. AB6]MEA9977828.1 hypothetical protein [Pseudomonas sp. RTS4]MEA9992873.1 hypothetical protein [Pseudomonas sp. AA4]MEB0088271.1 hypothetical protein [Pseudomonas sp. RTI1]MEB0125749.1 hypothetical protein [Pseudomonas sp. CCC1.2]
MDQQKEFEIYYVFNAEQRHFTHNAAHLCESEALHIATLHAGIVSACSQIAAGPLRLALQQAEGLGVTEVQWKRSC